MFGLGCLVTGCCYKKCSATIKSGAAIKRCSAIIKSVVLQGFVGCCYKKCGALTNIRFGSVPSVFWNFKPSTEPNQTKYQFLEPNRTNQCSVWFGFLVRFGFVGLVRFIGFTYTPTCISVNIDIVIDRKFENE